MQTFIDRYIEQDRQEGEASVLLGQIKTLRERQSQRPAAAVSEPRSAEPELSQAAEPPEHERHGPRSSTKAPVKRR